MLYKIFYFLSASHVSYNYNDVYADDHFQMEMVVNVKRMHMSCKHVDDVSLLTYIHTYVHTYISTAIFS